MPELILHHYPFSPFAEKIRLILGHKKLPWHSVFIPNMMPKPDVVALTGGHRRTPFLQIGSDIYCDTALVADVLEQLAPTPSLYPSAQKGVVRIVAQWADSQLFPVAMAYNFKPEAAQSFFAQQDPEQVKAFVADRTAMRGGAARMPASDAAAMYKSYLRRLSHMLEGKPFLFGEQACLADFSAVHPLWFTTQRVPVVADILNATPDVRTWVDRMLAIGHGESTPMTASDAIRVAHSAKPAALDPGQFFQDEHGIPLGSPVVIQAESFGTEPSVGDLVAATRTRYTIRRTDPRAGTVHVHFPRLGFVMKRVDA
jgi:glutathione S-transferase